MFPVTITFRDIGPSESVDAQIRRNAEKLTRYNSRIQSCHVTIEVPHKHHVHGNHYRVQIQLAIPGGDVVVGQHATEERGATDLHAAVDIAFAEAGRVVAEKGRRERDKHRRGQATELLPIEEASGTDEPTG